MKKPTSTIVLSALLFFGFTSCVKQVDQAPVSTVPDTVAKFSDLNPSGTFTWSTTQKINFSFAGSAGLEYQLVLKIADAEGNILFQKLQSANEDFKLVLDVPAHLQNVTVTYGSTIETFDCKTGTVSMELK